MSSLQTATLAGGCFWCTQAIFKRLKGIEEVISGYAGGNPPAGRDQPTYEQVSGGTTGYTESIQIRFNPEIISFEKILQIFWHLINPTTLNQQGADVGTQYRSVIFYHDKTQKEIAENSKKKTEAEKLYEKPIVTKIEPFTTFYPAEQYHQDYFDKNPDKAYCQLVINPKIDKLIQQFSSEVTTNIDE